MYVCMYVWWLALHAVNATATACVMMQMSRVKNVTQDLCQWMRKLVSDLAKEGASTDICRLTTESPLPLGHLPAATYHAH